VPEPSQIALILGAAAVFCIRPVARRKKTSRKVDNPSDMMVADTQCCSGTDIYSPMDGERIISGSSDVNTRIIGYWNRRSRLVEAEWIDFYRIVIPLLMRTRLPERYGAPSERRDLVNRFFQDKILFNAATSKAGPLQSVYVLHLYLRNYEKDLRKSERAHSPLDDPDHGLEQDIGAVSGGGDEPPAHVLVSGGLDARRVLVGADQFLATLDDGELACLRHNSCADHDESEPISSLATRFGMGAGHHAKVKRLGITRSKGQTYEGYERTAIGRWLLSMGALLRPDWREEVAALLILLCHQVRLHVRGRE
jgi:hypothetical protein